MDICEKEKHPRKLMYRLNQNSMFRSRYTHFFVWRYYHYPKKLVKLLIWNGYHVSKYLYVRCPTYKLTPKKFMNLRRYQYVKKLSGPMDYLFPSSTPPFLHSSLLPPNIFLHLYFIYSWMKKIALQFHIYVILTRN